MFDIVRGDKDFCVAMLKVLYKLNITHTLNVKIDCLCQITEPAILGKATRQYLEKTTTKCSNAVAEWTSLEHKLLKAAVFPY